jgi:hypothetical protein
VVNDTVDITSLVANMQQTFVKAAVAVAYAAIIAVPGLSWLALPILSPILKEALSFVIGLLAKDAMLEAFFMNTAIRNASNAADYVNAVNAKNNLPPTATKQEILEAEQLEISTFNSFVIIT